MHELLSGPERTLAFTRTKHGARTLARRLSEAGIPSLDLDGNLSQAARTRNLDAYLHRSGCTARAGSTGTVVTFATPEQRSALRTLLRTAKVTVIEGSLETEASTKASNLRAFAPRSAAPPSASTRRRPASQPRRRERSRR